MTTQEQADTSWQKLVQEWIEFEGRPYPYEVLGLARDATADEIKRAYRKLAHRYGPHANLSTTDATLRELVEEKLKRVNKARDLLLNRAAREFLDDHLRQLDPPKPVLSKARINFGTFRSTERRAVRIEVSNAGRQPKSIEANSSPDEWFTIEDVVPEEGKGALLVLRVIADPRKAQTLGRREGWVEVAFDGNTARAPIVATFAPVAKPSDSGVSPAPSRASTGPSPSPPSGPAPSGFGSSASPPPASSASPPPPATIPASPSSSFGFVVVGAIVLGLLVLVGEASQRKDRPGQSTDVPSQPLANSPQASSQSAHDDRRNESQDSAASARQSTSPPTNPDTSLRVSTTSGGSLDAAVERPSAAPFGRNGETDPSQSSTVASAASFARLERSVHEALARGDSVRISTVPSAYVDADRVLRAVLRDLDDYERAFGASLAAAQLRVVSRQQIDSVIAWCRGENEGRAGIGDPPIPCPQGGR